MAAEEIGNLIPTKIPGYSDDADIQAALRVYHYGSYDYSPSNTSPASLVSPSMAKTIYDIQQDIDALESGYISNTIFTAKGQILSATASNSPVVLNVGTNNQFLIANNATASGLQWTSSLTAPSISTPTISGGVTLNGSTTGSTVIQASSTAAGAITFPAVTGTVVTTGDTGTVTNTMLAGSIANAKLANSSITVNGTSISLGGSGTITANTTNALTIGTGLSGTSYNGSSAVTIAINSTVATTSGTQTLTNKTLTDSTTFFQDETDNSKKMQLQLSGITTSTTRTLTVPNVNGTIVTTGDTGTVTSTMIADGTIVNGDINASAAIAITKLSASTISGVSLGNNLNSLTIGTGLSGTSYNGSAAITIAIDSTVATTSGTQTLTNKTLTDSTTTFQDNTDNTKKMQFELSGINTGTTRTLTVPNVSGTIITTGDTGTVTSTMIANDTIVNADVNSAAAIAYSKLNLSSSIVNADIAAGAAISISKLAASTISGVSLGNNLNSLTIGSGLTGTSYNGSASVTVAIDTATVATVSSVNDNYIMTLMGAIL